MCNLVLIIIPLYNVEQYVEVALESAFNQTFADIEYILVDDCSTDQTMEVVDRLVAECSRRNSIKIVHHEKNGGLSAARNTGIEYASGNFIFFMDSDDEIVPDCIERHYEVLKASDADFTIANIRLEGAKSIHIKPISDEVKRIPLRTSYLKRMWSVSAWNKLYRRRFLEENELTFQEGLLHEDILWSYKVVSKAKTAAFVTEATYVYKIHQGSITTSKNSKRKIDSLLYILNVLMNEWNSGKTIVSRDPAFIRFFDFLRFNTVLLLLNYSGTRKEQRRYYQQLGNMCIGKYNDLYSFLLSMPFFIFSILIGPIYYVYKRL